MQALIFLNFPLYTTLQRTGFVAKWSVAMEFFASGFTSAFSEYFFEFFRGSSWSICLRWSWCFLVVCWPVGQGSRCLVLKLCSINFSIILIVTQVLQGGRIFLLNSFACMMSVMVMKVSRSANWSWSESSSNSGILRFSVEGWTCHLLYITSGG